MGRRETFPAGRILNNYTAELGWQRMPTRDTAAKPDT